MKNKILIKNMQKIKVKTRIFKKIANMVLEEFGFRDYELSIALVDNDFIKELNKKYRNKDKVTDVLAFPLKSDIEGENILGEIVISVEKAKEQAKEFNHSFEEELALLLIHGILHILGYDHEKKEDEELMKNKENYFLLKAKELVLKK